MSRTMVDFSLNLPPGFRFHPTDDELVKEYLIRKCEGQPLAAPVIAEVDLYRLDPWDLPGTARLLRSSCFIVPFSAVLIS